MNQEQHYQNLRSPVRVLTYGTFDLFHIGHLRLLERASKLGDELFVGVSTDGFNETKQKSSVVSFEHRKEIVSAISFVSHVFPEDSWDQKSNDIKTFDVSIFVMGDDWATHFDHLSNFCQVVYLPRTPGVSSSELKAHIAS